jgi:glycosyltransferase involved in cell wall biosynthesis
MIALIATVLNEGDHLHRLLRSIAAQTQPPDEIVIVDGGSTDHTVALLHEYARSLPLRVLVEPGANISQGRNRAIAAAQADVIAVTDAGVALAPDWLAQITRPLLDDPARVWVGGFFDAEATTPFELAMSATVLPLVGEVDPASFLPSSRSVAFRKAAWAAVGGYPEWLDYCEDLVFDFRMRVLAASYQLPAISYQPPATSHQPPASSSSPHHPITASPASSSLVTRHSSLITPPFAFAPAARVAFRPRGNLRSFWTQYYRYARGDGKADLWRKRHAIRYATYLIALPVAVGLGLLHPLAWLLLLIGAAVYLKRPYQRLWTLLRQPANAALVRSPLDWLRAVLLIPVIRVVGDLAKMVGYPVGWRWRLREKPPAWR